MTKNILKNIAGLLIDLDGVVYISNKAIPGAADAITRLKSKNIPIRFVTNTTTMSQDSLHKKMVSMGLPIEKHEIISAVQACVLYLRGKQKIARHPEPVEGSTRKPPTCYLVLTDDCKKDFAEFKQTEKNPDYVVIGDLHVPGMIQNQETMRRGASSSNSELRSGQAIGWEHHRAQQTWNYELLNRIFNMLITGSKMIALHKGKFWQTDQGLTFDIGIFVAGLEYVTGQNATVIGKPSITFFQMALKDLGVPASKAAMIGDDLDNDILGAQKAGIGKTILVKTGKYREELVKKSKIQTNNLIDSFTILN